MNINLRHYSENVKFNVEKEIDSSCSNLPYGEYRIYVYTNSQFYLSMSVKEADELCEKLKQCLLECLSQ